MPPLVPAFLLPPFLRTAPTPIKIALLAPGLLIGGGVGMVVQTIAVNLGAGNQHLSTANGGFDAWLIWIIVGAGLLLGLGVGFLVYIGVGLGADAALDEDEAEHGETGLLET